MKVFILIFSLSLILACSSSEQDWDSGAQRQEALLDESRGGIDESAKDQFPTSNSSTNEAQPF
jgi:hypothetical protein